MNLELFAAALQERFGADPYREDSIRPGLEDVVARVPGMSSPQALSVLADAVSFLDKDEIYLEVGSYRGRSLVGALSGSAGARGVGIENYGEFGGDRSERQRQLAGNIAAYGLGERARIVDGDAFRVLPSLGLPAPIGVYFYDGVHSSFGQYAGLGLAEHLLADRAAVLVDDATWPKVARATDRYVARHPGYRLLAEYRARWQQDPIWCNGLRIYAWERPASWRNPGSDVHIRAALQSHVTGPARALAWHVLRERPGVMNAVRRVVARGGTTVPRVVDGKSEEAPG